MASARLRGGAVYIITSRVRRQGVLMKIDLKRQFIEVHNSTGEDWHLTEYNFWQIKDEDYYNYRLEQKDGHTYGVHYITGKPVGFIQLKNGKWLLWEDDGILKRCAFRQHETTDNLTHFTLAK